MILEHEELVRASEAVIFASGEPIAVGRLAEIFGVTAEEAARACEELRERLEQSGSAIKLVKLDGQYQLCTRSEYGQYIRAALELRRNTPLSGAAMETLAIIAYNQPVTRNIIEKVRGVDSSGVVSSLVAKGLIEELGRLDLPGRPMQYGTTALFLRTFGIESLEELPPLPNGEDGQQPRNGTGDDPETVTDNDGSGDNSGYVTDNTGDSGGNNSETVTNSAGNSGEKNGDGSLEKTGNVTDNE